MKIIQHKKWSDQAEQGLSKTLADDKEILKQLVKVGNDQLWEIPDLNSWMITRVEHQKDQKILVICCYQGQAINKVGKAIVAAARAQGFTQLRYHTQRRGLNRLLKDFDFSYHETVYKKDLTKEIN